MIVKTKYDYYYHFKKDFPVIRLKLWPATPIKPFLVDNFKNILSIGFIMVEWSEIELTFLRLDIQLTERITDLDTPTFEGWFILSLKSQVFVSNN